MGERERERERERHTHTHTGRYLLFVLCNNVHTLMTNGITPIHHTPISLFNILSFFLSFFLSFILQCWIQKINLGVASVIRGRRPQTSSKAPYPLRSTTVLVPLAIYVITDITCLSSFYNHFYFHFLILSSIV